MTYKNPSTNSKNKTKLGRDRFKTLHALVVIVFAALILRLGYLQILEQGKFEALAESQRTQTSDLLPRRGRIFFSERGGEHYPVASSKKTHTVFAVPKKIEDLDKLVEKISDILIKFEQRERKRKEDLWVSTGQMEKEELEKIRKEREERSSEEKEEEEEKKKLEIMNDLRKRLGNPLDPYEPLISYGQKLDEEALSLFGDLNLPGIEVNDENVRYYPEGSLGSHVLGYIKKDDVTIKGEYGIERELNDILQGSVGFLAAERDTAGRWISTESRELKPAQDGADVVLTIDRVVQTLAEEVIKEGREKYKAEEASVIVMDPDNGAIKAMANYPDFDPNYFGDIRDVKYLNNSAVSDLFEPGSIFKPLIMATAMNLGLVDPYTTMQDAGPVRIGEFTIDTYDGQHHGTVTMTEILEHSNNIGMVWVAQKIGAERLYSNLRRFGIGDKTGISLGGEASRKMPPPESWPQTKVATLGFGQGVVVTPLQILTASASLVNGGKLLKPRIVEETRYASGKVKKTKKQVVRQVISPETATRISAMLTSVVENGVAAQAQVDGYYVGGKTGTAQVVDPKTGRYSSEKKIISFLGFAPAQNPEFIALIVLRNPKGLGFASGTAAPMFRELTDKLLDYYRIPPSRKKTEDSSLKLN